MDVIDRTNLCHSRWGARASEASAVQPPARSAPARPHARPRTPARPAAHPACLLSLRSGFKDLKVLDTKKHCLNLGSYNYLGFAAGDAYCTPRVQATLHSEGVSGCSSRTDAGACAAPLLLQQGV